PIPRGPACGHRQRRGGAGGRRDDQGPRRQVPAARSRRRMKQAGPRVALLAIGQFTRATAKTAIGVLRYATYPVVAVIDPDRAGTDAAAHVGVGSGVPVVATVADAIARGADVVLIGTAAAGGRIPDSYRPSLATALERGLEVWNGLHERVLDDPHLRAAAQRGGGRVRELREPPNDLTIG